MPGCCLSAVVAAKRVRGWLLAWRAAPGTTLETALHPLLHHRAFCPLQAIFGALEPPRERDQDGPKAQI